MIGGAVLLVAAVVIGAVVVVAVRGDRTSAPRGDGQTVQGPRRGVRFYADPAGEFTLSLPSGFRPISTRGDVAGAGAQVFPIHPETATALDRMLAGLPRSVVLVAPHQRVIGEEITVAITVERVDGNDLVPPDVTVVDVPRVVALPAGGALRVEYAEPRTDAEMVRWYVPADGAVWVLTFRAGDLAEFGGEVDALAASFELLGRGPRPEPVGPEPGSTPADPTTGLVPVSAPDGSFTAVVPAGWVHHVAGSGSPPVHEQLFPDDAQASSRVDDFLATLTTPETRMVAVDPEGWTVIPHQLVVFDALPGADPRSSTLDQLVQVARDTWVDGGGLLQDEGRLAGSAGEIGWYLVGLPGGALHGVQYVVPGPTTTWVVTVWSDDPGARQATGDPIAAGFVSG